MSSRLWITEEHKKKLVEARAILSSLIDGPLPGQQSIDTVQRNSDEYWEISAIIGDIEALLGY